MVSRVVNAIKTELKHPETFQERFRENTNKTEIMGKKKVIETETAALIETETEE